MTKTKLAYLAGLLDGEGCFSILRGGKTGECYSITIKITNSNLGLLRWVQANCGGHIHQYPKHHNWKDIFQWSLYASNAVQLVRKVRSFLVAKQRQADILLCFRNPKHPIDLASKSQLYLELRKLNKRCRDS